MRLHILPDQKIVNRTIETFEHVFPNDNKYIILSSTGNSRYVDVNAKNVYSLTIDSNELWNIVGDVSQYSSVVIHCLTPRAVRFLDNIKHDKIYWIEWGVDLYNILLEPRGFKLYSDDKEIEEYIYHSKWSRILHKYCSFLYPRRIYRCAIKKVRYFVPDSMYDEYPLLLSYYPQYSNLEYREFFYYPIDQVVNATIREERCNGKNIIVGHSYSYTGNHLEIMKLLSEMDLSDRQVKFPLSYGDSERYRDFLLKQGKELLGDSFSPQTNYMPLDEYNNYLLDASYFIYNSYRQEAVGNILVALYIGGKVFLSDNSPLLKFYKNLGLIIFPASSISNNSLNTPLHEEDIVHNREIIEKHYSLDRLYQLVEQNFA